MQRIARFCLYGVLVVGAGVSGLFAGPAREAAPIQGEEHREVTHKLGTVAIPEQPQRPVVFSYDILDLLQALDIQAAAIPMPTLPSYLARGVGEDTADAGTLFEPDYEGLFRLNPQVIFISDRQTPVYDQLSEIAPVVYTGIAAEDYLASLEKNWSIVGNLYGKQDQVEGYLEEITLRADTLAAAARESGLTALVLMVNDGSLSVYGPGSRFGYVYDSFGYVPADPAIETSTHGQSVSFEYLASQNPDILFVLDRGQALTGNLTADSVLDNEIVARTAAAREGRIVYVDPQAWYLAPGGLDSTRAILRDLESALE
ncbi:siderophore ABC transporter substrate-binding protein [Spirochaeta lutea]|uniref:siderophore ABC transporter substrate-binding protein n=1 Tax=Spirochaeta lutea TaxID=1480694 RepID=UPI00068A282E|nr:ABC transporter substrate-binding protein [Spirochaeta lutea]